MHTQYWQPPYLNAYMVVCSIKLVFFPDEKLNKKGRILKSTCLSTALAGLGHLVRVVQSCTAPLLHYNHY